MRKGWADRDPTLRQPSESDQSVSSGSSDNAISELKDTIQDIPFNLSYKKEERKSVEAISRSRVNHNK